MNAQVSGLEKHGTTCRSGKNEGAVQCLPATPPQRQGTRMEKVIRQMEL